MKESYRRCFADYEREKATRETLQQCVDALKANQKTIEKTKNDSVRPRNQSKDTPQNANNDKTRNNNIDHTNLSRRRSYGSHNIDQSECRFFNSKRGCFKGESCNFPHILHEPCNLGMSCKQHKCPFNHDKSTNDEHFLENRGNAEPPDITNRETQNQLNYPLFQQTLYQKKDSKQNTHTHLSRNMSPKHQHNLKEPSHHGITSKGRTGTQHFQMHHQPTQSKQPQLNPSTLVQNQPNVNKIIIKIL